MCVCARARARVLFPILNKGTYGGGREREGKNGKTLAVECRDLGER